MSLASTLLPALTPVIIFLKAGWILQGFLSTRASCSVCVSCLSRCCLVLPIYLFCSPVLYFTPVSSCIALFFSEQAGMNKSHVNHCCSVIPIPLVNPRWSSYSSWAPAQSSGQWTIQPKLYYFFGRYGNPVRSYCAHLDSPVPSWALSAGKSWQT